MADNVIFCSKCGTQSAAGDAFCQKCGETLAIGLAPQPTGAVIQSPPYRVPVPAVSPYGGFWIRFLAYVIDHILIGVVLGPLAVIWVLPLIISAVHSDDGPEPWMLGMLMLYFVAAAVFLWLYDALLTCSSWQGTVGKKLLRLKVTDMAGNRISFGRATGRFFAKILSRMMFHIGFIMAAFTERKQGLHDMIAATLVWKA